MPALYQALSLMRRQKLLLKKFITIPARHWWIWHYNFRCLGLNDWSRRSFRNNYNGLWSNLDHFGTNIIVNIVISSQIVNMIIVMEDGVSEHTVRIKVIIMSVLHHC